MSLPAKSRFPEMETWFAETQFESLKLVEGKPEHQLLLGPFDGQVGEAGDAHATWESTVDCSFDKIRREEREQIVMLTLRALQASRFAILSAVAVTPCEFIAPASASN